MQTTSNIIDKNWKALIKPNKLEITSNEDKTIAKVVAEPLENCLLYTSPSPRDGLLSRMPSSA